MRGKAAKKQRGECNQSPSSGDGINKTGRKEDGQTYGYEIKSNVHTQPEEKRKTPLFFRRERRSFK